jgi:hypothetical protein
MKALRILPLLLCLVVGAAAAQQQQTDQKAQRQTTAEAASSPEQQEILQASERLRQAMLTPNPDQLRRILAANYSATDMFGHRLDRTDAVNVIAFGPSRLEKVDMETQSIQVSGDSAVQTGSAYVQGTSRGGLFNTTYRFTRQWQRTNGEWKLVTTQIQGLGGTF